MKFTLDAATALLPKNTDCPRTKLEPVIFTLTSEVPNTAYGSGLLPAVEAAEEPGSLDTTVTALIVGAVSRTKVRPLLSVVNRTSAFDGENILPAWFGVTV